MRKAILVLFCFGICLKSQPQILKPVKWSYASKKTSEFEAVLFIKATVNDGWHIYSVNQKEGGPIKTSIHFVKSKKYVLTGKLNEPEYITKFEKTFEIDVHYFEKSVIFQQKIHLKSDPVVIKGTLEYMACNDEKCLPPEKLTFSIPVK